MTDIAGRLTESFTALGMPERAARVAAEGRDYRPADPFDRAVRVFRQLGMSEAQAKIAATGHATSEAAARREMAAAARPSAPARFVTVGGVTMSEAEFVRNGAPAGQNRPRRAVRRRGGSRLPLQESRRSAGRVAISECARPGCGVVHTGSACPKCRAPVAG